MKKLTRMKLINWHRFNNFTIEFGDSTLLSGENGAGKSTLLDAIQFVIICSTGYFNKAAHENGKRRLTGYIRCKTGKENQPYERTGEISAHVALEFYEESKDKYFIIGAVVDSASEGQETTVRYLMENTRISDDLFLYGNQVKSIAEFRGSNIDIRQWCKTNVEARRMVTARLGRIEDKFFRLIPKALAFKPIDDIKDFVYSYVLDEKEVNIDVLRENVRTYQDMERTLDNVKKRMKKLKKIQELYQRVQERIEKDRMYEYFLKRSELELVEGQLSNLETARKNEEIRLSQAKAQLEMLQKERSEKQEIATNIRVELRHNQEFVALEEEKVTSLMGRDYFVEGQVVHGRGMGHKVLLPTTNLVPPRTKILPPNGVYVTSSYFGDKIYHGITNIGCKPTVGESFIGVETYLFDCKEDLYGEECRVDFKKFLRPERKFPSLEALKSRLLADAEDGRRYFEKTEK